MKSLLAASAVLCALFATTLPAQTPAIKALENNYSYIVPGLPNYGIAQGSIFDIFGTNLANTSTGLQSPPPATLSGVTVSVTVGGTTKQALLYYVTPGQIAAILPSSVPVGTGQITVTNNGVPSAAAPIVVVQSAFGIMTLNGAGTGPAAAFNASNGNGMLGASSAANPGDRIVLWGTGAGPVADDTQRSATTAPLEIDIGGTPATVEYHGRSDYPGLDQINIVVPSGLSGCYVSVVARSGNYVSNYASIPVTASGRTCSDVTTGLSGGLTSSQIQALNGKSNFTVGVLGLSKTSTSTPAIVVGGITASPATTYTFDFGSAAFTRVVVPQQTDLYVSQGASNTVASIGSCSVYNVVTDTSQTAPPTTTTSPTPVTGATTTSLNAGPAINVTGPNGTKSMPFQSGSYGAQLGGGSGATATPVFIAPGAGTYTFDNGTGGPDIGPFSVKMNLNPVTWTNQSALGTVNRSQNTTVTWTGGDPNTYVSITGSSTISQGTTFIFGLFTCTAPASAQQFTIPAAVLLSLPPTGSLTTAGISIPLPGTLALYSFNLATTLNIPGVDIAYGYAYSGNGITATYQ